jgi:hypothetical protein
MSSLVMLLCFAGLLGRGYAFFGSGETVKKTPGEGSLVPLSEDVSPAVFWLHIQKCGTQFSATIYLNLCDFPRVVDISVPEGESCDTNNPHAKLSALRANMSLAEIQKGGAGGAYCRTLWPRKQSLGDRRLQNIVDYGVAKCRVRFESKIGHAAFDIHRGKGIGVALFREPKARLVSQTFHNSFFQKYDEKIKTWAALSKSMQNAWMPMTSHKMKYGKLKDQLFTPNGTYEEKLRLYLGHPANAGVMTKMVLGHDAGAEVYDVVSPCHMKEARRRVEEEFVFLGITDECKLELLIMCSSKKFC